MRHYSRMNFLLIVVCVVSGYSLRASKVLGKDAHKGINAWILYVAFPAIALEHLPYIQWKFELLLPLAMPFIIWTGAWIFLKLTFYRTRIDARTFGALLLATGVANTSFIGFPLTQSYFGNEGLRLAVICDQITFVLLSSLGVIAAMRSAHASHPDFRKILMGLIKFPPFLAFVAALTIPRFVSLAAYNPFFEKIGATLVPLALFSIGMQVQFGEWRNEKKYLFYGLGYRLFISPAILLGIALILGIRGIVAQASIFEAAMPPSITGSILAGQYELNPKLAGLITSIGILLSFATTALWQYLLHRTF
jgi:malate permease and related proteins